MLGAAVVFFLKKGVPPLVEKFMLGFAAGVMIAASVFSLLLPAMEEVERLHQNSWPGDICWLFVGNLLFIGVR